jgi:hypothetical protein
MKYFGKQTISNTFKAVAGIGTKTVAIPFVPDYIKVDFGSPVTSSRSKEDLQGDDEVYWNLTAVTPTTYQIDIGWSTYTETREIYFQVARLTVDPV